MGLSAGQYSMQCWNSTQNPDQMNRAQLLSQSFRLIKEMQQRFTNGEIAVPSTDTKQSRKGIEICILYPAGASLFADIADFLTQAATRMGLEYRNFVKQDAGITRYFNQQEMDNVSLLGKPVPDELTEQAIARTIAAATELKGPRMNDSWKNGVPAKNRAAPFQITRSTLQRLHVIEGDELAAEIRSIMEAITVANKETKSSTSLIVSIARGVVAIVGELAELCMSIHDVMIIWNIVVEGAPILAGGILLSVIGVFINVAVHLTFKDAANVLLVANDTPNDIMPRMEWIENGERSVVPEIIPATVPNADLVSCGLFVYIKNQVVGVSLGLYGSAFGVSFDTGDGRVFSVGMDCPNSLMGGNNSIEVHNQEHAQRACQMALKSGCMHGWTDHPWVDVKIADHWGNINWGRAVLMKD